MKKSIITLVSSLLALFCVSQAKAQFITRAMFPAADMAENITEQLDYKLNLTDNQFDDIFYFYLDWVNDVLDDMEHYGVFPMTTVQYNLFVDNGFNFFVDDDNTFAARKAYFRSVLTRRQYYRWLALEDNNRGGNTVIYVYPYGFPRLTHYDSHIHVHHIYSRPPRPHGYHHYNYRPRPRHDDRFHHNTGRHPQDHNNGHRPNDKGTTHHSSFGSGTHSTSGDGMRNDDARPNDKGNPALDGIHGDGGKKDGTTTTTTTGRDKGKRVIGGSSSNSRSTNRVSKQGTSNNRSTSATTSSSSSKRNSGVSSSSTKRSSATTSTRSSKSSRSSATKSSSTKSSKSSATKSSSKSSKKSSSDSDKSSSSKSSSRSSSSKRAR